MWIKNVGKKVDILKKSLAMTLLLVSKLKTEKKYINGIVLNLFIEH